MDRTYSNIQKKADQESRTDNVNIPKLRSVRILGKRKQKSYKVQLRLFELKVKHDLRCVSTELRGEGTSLRLNIVTQILNTAVYVKKLNALWQALNHSFLTRYSPHHFSIFSDRSLEIMSIERSIVNAIEQHANHGRILHSLHHPLPESIKHFVTQMYLFNSLEWESMKGKPRRDTYPRTLEFVPDDPPGYWVIQDIPDCVLDPTTDVNDSQSRTFI